MDLVDIDKVLDDLELNEDEKSAAAQQNNKTVPARKHQPALRIGHHQPVVEANNNTKIASNSKSFVNITNVFSSLNEYVNVDIERSIRPVDAADTKLNQHDYQEIRNVQNNEDDEDDRTEDYPEDADGPITSTSSITTSSPSSFSSGPSPGSSSDTGSFISEEKVLAERQVNGHQDSSLTKHDGVNDRIENDSETRNLIDGERQQDDMDVANDNNSGELGLSSISSCLYNENTSSSVPGLSHDLIKIYALSSISSSSQSTPKDDDDDNNSEQHPGHDHDDQTLDQSSFPHVEQVADAAIGMAQTIDTRTEQPKEPIVIGFGSTMDEISDTELDSILQEIDSDLQAFNGTATAEISHDSPKETAEPYRSEKLNEEIIDEDITEPNKTSPLPDRITIPQQPDLKKISDLDDDDHDNLPNADSFSQASTIEFAESRLQSDFGTDATIPAAGSDNIQPDDRSTSSNSGTRNEELQPPRNDTAQPPRNDTDVSVALVPKMKMIQRPNSLDLPVQSLDVNSTAGQTPPASRHVDERNNAISTSSSDDVSPISANPVVQSETTATTRIAPTSTSATNNNNNSKLGKVPPFWIPDSEAAACMQCKQRFSLLKRRHHCRACGKVLCSVCCSQKAKLEFLEDSESRICVQCHLILNERPITSSDTAEQIDDGISDDIPGRPPNPNNPMEYCSIIPPHQQVSGASSIAPNPISVMVPVGVLKREGAPSKNPRKTRSVIFSDGIRPGCDLTHLDYSWDNTGAGCSKKTSWGSNKRAQTPPGNVGAQRAGSNGLKTAIPSHAEPESYIPDGPNELPPIYTKNITQSELTEVRNNALLITRLQSETLQFAIQPNFYVFVKITKLKCCINKTVINFTTHGLHHVGQDEIVILLDYDEKSAQQQQQFVPKDIFTHLYEIYRDADRGRPISELGFSVPNAQNFLGSREHGGFIYIRSSFQCLQEIRLPDAPFLIGILIHRLEMPWAKIFPLRLMLRLGAEYRYYPSPHISIRFRDSVYVEIAQTIINFLADFRNYSYTLATIRGMYIHMEDRKTSVLIPKNRYDEIFKALNNSSDHILALGGSFSKTADGHLVCIQNTESDSPEMHTYSTQAINIQGQPRKVTGASFLVLNGALKSTSGLSGKCSIVEDGLMVQILPSKMTTVQNSLKIMKDIEIVCGPVDANESQTEIVSILWTDNDMEFNIGVKSPIDEKKMDGIPSIRVHSSLNYSNTSRMIRWTEVFIIQSEDESSAHGKDPIDISKLSEQIAKCTSTALVSFLDLLSASGFTKIGLRTTLHPENVCYEAGSLNSKLAPLYMNALDNELIPTLHRQITTLQGMQNPIVLELIFHILDK